MSKSAETSLARRYLHLSLHHLGIPHANYLIDYSPQVYSDALDIQLEAKESLPLTESSEPVRGVFIRAPAILIAGEGVEVIATLEAKPHISATAEVLKVIASSDGKVDMSPEGKVKVIVAVQQGNILATAFHPELTPDLRWHQYVSAPC